MRRIYQQEWHGVRFSEFWPVSDQKLAGPEFYEAFYKRFFEIHAGWMDLPPAWREEKELVADFILSSAGPAARILSVGCGLGVIERTLLQKRPGLQVSIHEVSSSAWRWVESDFPQDRKFVGKIPECLPAGAEFDLIFLGAIDYVFDDPSLRQLLCSLRPFLSHHGRCLLVSASFDPGTNILIAAKNIVRAILAPHRERSSQFWGWARSRTEYRNVLTKAGYGKLEDGFLDPVAENGYWLSGR